MLKIDKIIVFLKWPYTLFYFRTKNIFIFQRILIILSDVRKNINLESNLFT